MRYTIFARSGLLGAFLALVSGSISAQVLEIETVTNAMISSQKNLPGFYMETENRVFVPAGLLPAGLAGGGGESFEMPENAFRQKILFIRHRFLGVLTFSETGKPLHFALGGGRVSQSISEKSLSETRKFSELDVYPPFVFFFSGFPEDYLKTFGRYGINPNRVSYSPGDSGISYKIGDSGGYAVVGGSKFGLEELSLSLEGLKEDSRLTVKFGAWDSETGKIPQKIETFLDGALIKVAVVKDIRFKGFSKIKNEFELLWKDASRR